VLRLGFDICGFEINGWCVLEDFWGQIMAKYPKYCRDKKEESKWKTQGTKPPK